MDEEAKVRAHAVLDSGASSDEALEAVLPRLVIGMDVVLVNGGSVTIVGTKFVILRLVAVVVYFSIGQEDTNGAVTTSLKSLQLTGVLEVIAHELRSGNEGWLKPDAAISPQVAVGSSFFLWCDAWSAGVTVGGQESVHPQFVVNFMGSATRNSVDGVDPLQVGFTVHQGSAFGRGTHGVDEFVEVSNQFVMVVNANVPAQHPVREHLDKMGGLFTVQTGDQRWLEGLAEVSDEFAVFGLLPNFKLVKVESELATEALCSASHGTCIFIKGGDTLGSWGFFMFIFRDVDDQLAFVVSNVGGALLDHGSSAAAVFSSS